MRGSKWEFVALTLACLAVVLVAIEIERPYYFLQDDNRDSNLPYLVYAYRGLLRGEAPLYDGIDHLSEDQFDKGTHQLEFEILKAMSRAGRRCFQHR